MTDLHITRENFAIHLRTAFVRCRLFMRSLPQGHPFRAHVQARFADYYEKFLYIADTRVNNVATTTHYRHEHFLGQRDLDFFMDLDRHEEGLAQLMNYIDIYWVDHDIDWELPSDGLFDADSQKAVDSARMWVAAYRKAMAEKRAQRQNQSPQTPTHDHLDLPHAPNPFMMDMQWNAAREAYRAHTPERDQLAVKMDDHAWLATAADQYVILGLCSWFLKRTFYHGLRPNLWRGSDCYFDALVHGAQPHAWDIERWLHIAIACRHAKLVDKLIALREEDWDTNRIRPVNWLVTRIRILMDLWRGDDSRLAVLRENSRLGIFVDVVPEELKPDLPLMRNWHHLVTTVIDRDPQTLTRLLEERQTLRIAHLQAGGTIAPTGLVDLDAIALLRVARRRGLTVTVTSPYLPEELMRDGEEIR